MGCPIALNIRKQMIMTNKLKQLAIIEDKIGQLDFLYLNKMGGKFLYRNPYFLVCFSEVITDVSNNTPTFVKNMSMDDLLGYLNKKAENLYHNSNISEHLQTVSNNH